DEILDIRRELELPLLRFRREVVRLSGAMAEHALAEDFADDIDREWHSTVRPALAEIEEAMASNTYLSVLATKRPNPSGSWKLSAARRPAGFWA
ncbi:MAG TPA: hypothetical protein VFD94_04145, partial [Jatrophihabitans sp.]|nr:hypothetical protein [Jatrophihabitans sp.]